MMIVCNTCSKGSEKGALQLAGATNDAFTRGRGGLAAYMFVVDKADYYKTLPLAAKTLSDYLGTGNYESRSEHLLSLTILPGAPGMLSIQASQRSWSRTGLTVSSRSELRQKH